MKINEKKIKEIIDDQLAKQREEIILELQKAFERKYKEPRGGMGFTEGYDAAIEVVRDLLQQKGGER